MRSLPLALAAFLTPTFPALAHAPIQGVSGIYAGFLHPLIVPGHLLTLLALGLLLGQHATSRSRWGWCAFVLGLCVGLVFAQSLAGPLPAAALPAIALVSGLLVSLGRPLAIAPLMLLGMAGGLGIGLETGLDTISGSDGRLPLVGAALSGILVLSCIGGLAARPTQLWHQVGVRVVGSWAAASAGIVLAFVLSMRPASELG